MISRRVLLCVEGPHDEAFVGRLLRVKHKFKSVLRLSKIDPVWRVLVPTSFPHNDDLQQRMPVPFFYQSDDSSVAILIAVGDTRLASSVKDTLAVLPPESIHSVGIFLDADHEVPPVERFGGVRARLVEAGLHVGDNPGEIGNTAPRCGVFVLPDNKSYGTLESVLLDCAEVVYPSGKSAASALVSSVNAVDYGEHELDEFNKRSGQAKATVSIVASILKPGKALQNSIANNRWVDDKTLTIPKVAGISSFVEELLRG